MNYHPEDNELFDESMNFDEDDVAFLENNTSIVDEVDDDLLMMVEDEDVVVELSDDKLMATGEENLPSLVESSHSAADDYDQDFFASSRNTEAPFRRGPPPRTISYRRSPPTRTQSAPIARRAPPSRSYSMSAAEAEQMTELERQYQQTRQKLAKSMRHSDVTRSIVKRQRLSSPELIQAMASSVQEDFYRSQRCQELEETRKALFRMIHH